MSRAENFARRLSAAVRLHATTRSQLARDLRIDYKRFSRWCTQGITRPTAATAADLEKLRNWLWLGSVGELFAPLEEPPRVPPNFAEVPAVAEFERKALDLFGSLDPIVVESAIRDVFDLLIKADKSDPKLLPKIVKIDPNMRYWYWVGELLNGTPPATVKAKILRWARIRTTPLRSGLKQFIKKRKSPTE